MSTIDYLGPATPDQLDDVKSARSAEQRKAMKETAAVYLLLAVVLATFALGTVLGKSTEKDVTDLWKFVPSLSGERVEPEESAK